jgi:hypothetical protein
MGMGDPGHLASREGSAKNIRDLTDGMLAATMELTIFIDTKDERFELVGSSGA